MSIKDIEVIESKTNQKQDECKRIFRRTDTIEEVNAIDELKNDCNEINETIEDITDCEVIDNNMNIKCEVINEECNQRSVKTNLKNSLVRNELFENKTLLSDSPLHTMLGYRTLDKVVKFAKEYNFNVDFSRLKKYEYTILKRNWDKFCDDYQITDDCKLLLLGCFK